MTHRAEEMEGGRTAGWLAKGGMLAAQGSGKSRKTCSVMEKATHALQSKAFRSRCSTGNTPDETSEQIHGQGPAVTSHQHAQLLQRCFGAAGGQPVASSR